MRLVCYIGCPKSCAKVSKNTRFFRLWNSCVLLPQNTHVMVFYKTHEFWIDRPKNMQDLLDLFSLPLSIEAFQQLEILQGLRDGVVVNDNIDIWTTIRGTFAASKVYKHSVQPGQVPPMEFPQQLTRSKRFLTRNWEFLPTGLRQEMLQLLTYGSRIYCSLPGVFHFLQFLFLSWLFSPFFFYAFCLSCIFSWTFLLSIYFCRGLLGPSSLIKNIQYSH